MLIPMSFLHEKYEMEVEGVLHVGAHLAEELEAYDELGYSPVYWIEAQLDTASKLRERLAGRPGHHVLVRLMSDVSNEMVHFNVANNGQSSSILEFGTHSVEHPEVEFIDSQLRITSTVDDARASDAVKQQCNLINLDVQGAELKVLKGATEFLKGVDYIYAELNLQELYKGCPLVSEIQDFLEGFTLVESSFTIHGWGDGFFVRDTCIPEYLIP